MPWFGAVLSRAGTKCVQVGEYSAAECSKARLQWNVVWAWRRGFMGSRAWYLNESTV